MKRLSLILITDKNKKILLQHRDNNAPTNPNKWGLWGGSLEGTETPVEAAIRELKEELHIKVRKEDLKFFKTYKKKRFGEPWEGNVFSLSHKKKFKYKQGEGDAMSSFYPKDFSRIKIDRTAVSILTDFYRL